MRALERAFPTGEWVSESALPQGRADSREGVPVLANAGTLAAPSLTIIGGTKYDEDELEKRLHDLVCVANIPLLVAGDGRGAERFALQMGVLWGIRTNPIPVDPDRYGKLARKVNVEQVLSHDLTSPVLLVGGGERVKQAKAWLERMKLPREVIELP